MTPTEMSLTFTVLSDNESVKATHGGNTFKKIIAISQSLH